MAPPINDYQIASATSLARLVMRVTELIDDGWEPTGGVHFAQHRGQADRSPEYLQAMVKGPGGGGG